MTQATITDNESSLFSDGGKRHPLFYLFGVVGFCMFLAIGYGYQLMHDPGKFPIRKISVDGDFVYLEPTNVQRLVSDAVTGGFFSLDVEGLRERISEHPWILDASVRRIWPDSISVSIHEQNPIAAWGDSALLNSEADIFAPIDGESPPDLVRLQGPIGSEQVVLTKFKVLRSSFVALGLNIETLVLSERRAWIVYTRSGVRLYFGRDNIEQKVRRFQLAYNERLQAQWLEIEQIDLRYTNGLTIKRHKQVADKS